MTAALRIARTNGRLSLELHFSAFHDCLVLTIMNAADNRTHDILLVALSDGMWNYLQANTNLWLRHDDLTSMVNVGRGQSSQG